MSADRSPRSTRSHAPQKVRTAAVDASLRPAAESLFGARLPLAEAYARLLVTEGVKRGLIGPREEDRIWERHLLNCAAVAELIRPSVTVLDVGSGAGLPGVVLAVARADLTLVLVEPMARRAEFLTEAVAALGLTNTTVVRARAEECAGRLSAPVVTARAVAPLDRLVGWCLPLVEYGGHLLALKGATAAEEVSQHRLAVVAHGAAEVTIHECGTGVLPAPTVVVDVVSGRRPDFSSPAKSTPSRQARPERERMTGRKHSARSGESTVGEPQPGTRRSSGRRPR